MAAIAIVIRSTVAVPAGTYFLSRVVRRRSAIDHYRKDRHPVKHIVRTSALLVCVLVSCVASASTFCPVTPPVIDGVFDCREWDSADTIDLQVNLPEGGTAPARLYLMNDDKFLYVGLRILREKIVWATSLGVMLDANEDRQLSAGDDVAVLTHDTQGGYFKTDGVYFTGGICPINALCSGSDLDFGGTNDMDGAVGRDGTYVTYEMSKYLVTTDGLDATMPIGSSIGMTFDLRLFSVDGKYADSYYPALPSSGQYVDYVIANCNYYWH